MALGSVQFLLSLARASPPAGHGTRAVPPLWSGCVRGQVASGRRLGSGRALQKYSRAEELQHRAAALGGWPPPLGLSLLLCEMGAVNQAHLNIEPPGSGALGVLTRYVTHGTQASLYLVFGPEQAADALTQIAPDGKPEWDSGTRWKNAGGGPGIAFNPAPQGPLITSWAGIPDPAASPCRGLSQAEGPHVLRASLRPPLLGALGLGPAGGSLRQLRWPEGRQRHAQTAESSRHSSAAHSATPALSQAPRAKAAPHTLPALPAPMELEGHTARNQCPALTSSG